MELISSVLKNVYALGRKQATAISPVPYLLRAYDLQATKGSSILDQENRCPNNVTKEIWKLRCSLNQKNGSRGVVNAVSPSKVPVQHRSVRDFVASSRQSQLDDIVERLVKGHPPHPATTWTHKSLIDALVTLAPTWKTNEFIKKMISRGNSPYKTSNAVYKVFKL